MSMVLISMVRDDGPAYFEVRGHADYQNPETGNNDVCVSLSTIVTMFGRWLSAEYGIEPTVCENGHAIFNIPYSNSKINELLKSIRHHIAWLCEQYPEQVVLM